MSAFFPMLRTVALGTAFALAACAHAASPPASSVAPPGDGITREGPSGTRSFDDELAFLRAHGPVDVLEGPGGGRVAVSARWQGRVMTSTVEAHGASLGFVHHAFFDAGKTGTPFDNFGGEDRFWLGPEGGQFGLYFAPGASFTVAFWQAPHAMQEGEWETRALDRAHAVFARSMRVVNASGAAFDVAVERTVRVLGPEDVTARFGAALPPDAKWVALETQNRVTNAGTRAWSPETGLLSIWILGMYNPPGDVRVLAPFDPAAGGPVVNDAYFGAIGPDRLSVHTAEGWLSLVADGKKRGKIGLGPARAREVIGSYSPSQRLLTILHYTRPTSVPHGYVNSMWQKQENPYGGDVVNAYNDGPTEPGKPSLGGFYELETSSPAAALGPGQSIEHVQTTLHLVGDPASLDVLARRVLGLPLTAP